MLGISRVIVSLVYYNSLVRDTLEYTLLRDTFNPEFYNYKKNGITKEIELNTPLKNFLDKNGEKGDELRKRIVDFIDEFYSEKSNIIKLDAAGVLTVDHNQNLRIFEATLPLHEHINSVIKLHQNYAQEHNEVEEKITDLLAADEMYYRGIALFTLLQQFELEFTSYNKARSEANGEVTPQSNFIQNTLNTLVQLAGLVRQTATCTETLYTETIDLTFNLIETMNGKRKLPEGSKFPDLFRAAIRKANELILISEEKWKNTYKPCIDEMSEDLAKAREAEEAAKTE